MKLIKRPSYIKNRLGQKYTSHVKIWSPHDEAGRTFEKLRTGQDIVLDVGKHYNHLVFKDEGITLYDVIVFESFGDDTFRCEIDRFEEWR